MAPSKTLLHGRSLSLPSSSHPALSHFGDNLSRLRSTEAAACSSLSSMNSRISSLRNLYESIDDLLLIQQNISEECVDDCISLLDACSSVKDLISLVKEDLRKLLSAVRRKDVAGINNYLASRKMSKKMIQKLLKSLRHNASSANTVIESENMTVVSMVKEAESVAFSQLESLLTYVLGLTTKKSSWSLVLKSKKASDDENEFNKVDSLLQQNQENELVNHIKEMDSSIEVLEDDLECIFRQLIKTRVSLLNILNH